MTSLMRLLGVHLVSRLGRRLNAATARSLSALVLVVANLLPVWAAVEGRLGMGDVLLVYLTETLVVWFLTTVKLLTTKRRGLRPAPRTRLEAWLAAKPWVSGEPRRALSFAAWFGLFALLHGVLTGVLVALTGVRGTVLDWAACAGVILFSHVFSVGLNWFGRRERSLAAPRWVWLVPFPRMVGLQGTVLLGLVLLGGTQGRTAQEPGAVALVMLAKTLADLVLHVAEHVVLDQRAARGRRPGAGGDAGTDTGSGPSVGLSASAS